MPNSRSPPDPVFGVVTPSTLPALLLLDDSGPDPEVLIPETLPATVVVDFVDDFDAPDSPLVAVVEPELVDRRLDLSLVSDRVVLLVEAPDWSLVSDREVLLVERLVRSLVSDRVVLLVDSPD